MARNKAKAKVEPEVAPKEQPVAVEERATKCVICDKEYTFRKMSRGVYEGEAVCTGCLPKALAADIAREVVSATMEE